MKSRKPYSAFPFVMFILGGGIAMLGSYLGILTLGMRTDVSDGNEGEWTTITIGGIVTTEIPATCTASAAAGTMHVTCPTAENPTPTPEMTFSSDGETVFVRRWEGLDSPYWDHMVSSIRVIQPMTRDITISIEQ